MATFKIPSESKICKKIYTEKVDIEFQITCPKLVPKSLSDLIENMLAYYEEKRFNINQVANHKWFVSDMK